MGQPQADRAEHNAVDTDPDVILVEKLCNWVVAANIQRDMADTHALGVDEPEPGSRRSGRDPALKNEHTFIAEVPAGILKASDLVVLSE